MGKQKIAEMPIFIEEIRMILEKPTNPKSILCKVPPHMGAQNRAENQFFKEEIGTDIERPTDGISKRLKTRPSKRTRAASSRGPRQGFYSCRPKPGHLKTHQCSLKVNLAAGRQAAVARRQAAWEQREGWRAAGG